MSATLQANKGGELHRLSDKFYKGGQFMPEPDVFASSKRTARNKAASFVAFTSPEIASYQINGKIPVMVTPVNSRSKKTVAWAASREEAESILSELRKMIETRLGGSKLSWD